MSGSWRGRGGIAMERGGARERGTRREDLGGILAGERSAGAWWESGGRRWSGAVAPTSLLRHPQAKNAAFYDRGLFL